MLAYKAELLEIIKKSKSRQGFTNCMLPLPELETKINLGKFLFLSEEPLVVVEDCDGFYQLYFFLTEEKKDKDDLSVNLDNVLQEFTPLYSDITLKGDFQYEGSMFEKLGLPLFRTYIRKSVINKDLKIRKLMDTEFAVSSDMEEIYNMLKEQFDLMCDHIPTKDELVEMIHKNQILKIAIKNQIAGVLLFEDFGKRAYARALCVVPDYQNSFVGYALLADYFSRHLEETRLFYLWVDEANMQVKKLHDRFGYQFDGLKNYIFRRG